MPDITDPFSAQDFEFSATRRAAEFFDETGEAYGLLRLDSALWQARLDECGAGHSGWHPPSLNLRRTGGMRWARWKKEEYPMSNKEYPPEQGTRESPQ